MDTCRADGEPLKVGLDRVGFTLREACAVVAAREGVVGVCASRLPSVVCDFVVVPDELPGVSLMQELQVRVGSVGLVSLSVLVEGEDLLVGLGDSATKQIS